MHANVTSGEIKSGQINNFLIIYEESVKPVVEAIPGLKNLYVLTNENSKAMVIAIYASKEDAENADQDGHAQEAYSKLAGTLVIESFSRDSYAVSIQI